MFFRYAQPKFLAPTAGSDLYNEYFVALDGDLVRGGYAIKHQRFLLPDGAVESIGYYHHPLSEGIVNRSWAVVGSLLLRDAMQRSPFLYCLGMGGYDRPLPKMLIGLGWNHCQVPFYFQVLRPARFLREMQALRTSPVRRFLMNLAAFSGAGALANLLYRAYSRFRAHTAAFSVTPVDSFDARADSIWEETKTSASLVALRDSRTLRRLYPPEDQHFTRLLVSRDGSDIGWAVVGRRRKDAKYGEMQVGSIVDCLASPENALPVVLAASRELERQGMDLVVSNQSHSAWSRAFQQAGFFEGPSNFIFAASKKLSARLHPFEDTKKTMHFTRADGDGLPRNF